MDTNSRQIGRELYFYIDLMKGAEYRSIWWTTRRDCHKPVESAGHWRM